VSRAPVRLLTLALVGPLAGCPGASSPALPGALSEPSAPEATRAPRDGRPTPLVAQTLATMSHVRGLAATRPVLSVTLGREALLSQVKQHVEREVPATAIRAEGLVQKLLGFFPVDEDYEAATYALLLGQLAGYYEPANGTMYLAEDLDDANARSTLAHELVHALQDQHWDLRTRSLYVAGQEDKDDALSALAEGDASSAMEDELLSRVNPGATALSMPDQELKDALVESVASGPAARAPHALRMALIAPYADGLAFVNVLRRQGGWARVDEAWSHLPETTEQILHPEKWRTHEPALVLPAPPPPTAGFTLLDANTLGEETLRLTFEEWMPEARAIAAASGWGGDRAALYQRGEREYAYVWHIRFDDASPDAPDAFAGRAFMATRLALPRLGRVAGADARRACVERHDSGVIAILRDGQDLFYAFGSVTLDPHGWHASMSCAEAHAWNEAALLAYLTRKPAE
jgi:hypothetical protein